VSTTPTQVPDASFDRPRAVLARRPLHFFIVADCSGSMASAGKMASLNTAVREVLPHLVDVAAANPHADLRVRVLRFASGASWHVGEPTRPDDLEWQDLTAGGYTDLGAALDLLTAALTVPPMEERALAPAVVLVSDGMPTDDYGPSLEALLALPWGARSVRMAVAIGHDADYETLDRFIADPDLEPVTAANPEQLVLALRWASTQVSRAASTLAPVQAPPDDLVRAWEPAPGDEVVW
jgi:uncharacterized protein YegL